MHWRTNAHTEDIVLSRAFCTSSEVISWWRSWRDESDRKHAFVERDFIPACLHHTVYLFVSLFPTLSAGIEPDDWLKCNSSSIEQGFFWPHLMLLVRLPTHKSPLYLKEWDRGTTQGWDYCFTASHAHGDNTIDATNGFVRCTVKCVIAFLSLPVNNDTTRSAPPSVTLDDMVDWTAGVGCSGMLRQPERTGPSVCVCVNILKVSTW